MSKRLLVFAIILFLVGGGGIYFLFIKKTIIEVKTVGVEREDLVKTVSAPGKIVPGEETTIYAPLSGVILEIKVEEGAGVSEEEVIALYDKTPLEVIYNQTYAVYVTAKLAKAQLEKNAPLPEEIRAAEALVDQTKQALDVAQKNYDNNANDTTRAALNATQTNYESAQASLARLRQNFPSELARQKTEADVVSSWATFQKAKTDLNKIEIKTPHSGVVLYEDISSLLALSGQSQKIEKGMTVNAGESLFKINNESLLTFEAEVDEIDIEKISLEQEANVALDALEGKKLKGKVSFIAPTSGKTADGEVIFKVKINLEETDLLVKMGLTGDVTFILEKKNNVLSVPYEAVFVKKGQSFVFVVAQNILVKREVVLGEEVNGEWEVIDGVQEGEKVAVENVEKLKDGQSIKITST